MNVSIEIRDADDASITVDISDDNGYTPEVLCDILRRAGDEALAVHARLHPADDQ